MTAHRWLGVSLAWLVAAAAFASCKGSTTAGTGAAGGGGASTQTAGTGGTAGATTGTGGGKVDAGPIVCAAKYTNVASAPCDLINQTCPSGSTCQVVAGAGGTTICQASWGLKTADEDCYQTSECDARLTCIGSTPVHPGKCVAFCCPDPGNEPCNGGICNEQVQYGGGVFAYVCSYGKRCQLLSPNACPSGFDCHVEPAAGQGIAVCLERSPSAVGELGTCHFINDCDNMVDCYGLTGTTPGVCLYYCALSGAPPGTPPGLGGCPTGESCQPDNTGVTGVGLCIPDGGIPSPDAGAGDAGDGGVDDAGDGGVGDGGDGGVDDGGDGGIDDAGADG